MAKLRTSSRILNMGPGIQKVAKCYRISGVGTRYRDFAARFPHVGPRGQVPIDTEVVTTHGIDTRIYLKKALRVFKNSFA